MRMIIVKMGHEIKENVEWTRKSPFGYATQVYRVLQAAL